MDDSTYSLEPTSELAHIGCYDQRFELYSNDQMLIVTSDCVDLDTKYSVKFRDSYNVFNDIATGDKFTRLGTNENPHDLITTIEVTTIETQDPWYFKVEGFIHNFLISHDGPVTLMLFKSYNTFEVDSLNNFATEAYYAVVVSPDPNSETEGAVVFSVVDLNRKLSFITQGIDFTQANSH